MITELAEITALVGAAFSRLAPYLLVTIPLAVAVQLSGASRFLERALSARPGRAILLATLVGAFSPFCSCGVVPVVASLLIGGVPLAPVMSFWIASPSMDPEIFLLSVGTLGWELAVWRLGATLVLSLAAGWITQSLLDREWLGAEILRLRTSASPRLRDRLASALRSTRDLLLPRPLPEPALACAHTASAPVSQGGNSPAIDLHASDEPPKSREDEERFWIRLWRESASATWLVARFMALAIVLEVAMVRYLPTEWIAGLLGTDQPLAIPLAAVIGIPFYTSNLSAVALVGSLLGQGMSAGAALTFLISGATTTIPAMAAVWGLVRPRVFLLYFNLVFLGSMALGASLLLVQTLSHQL